MGSEKAAETSSVHAKGWPCLCPARVTETGFSTSLFVVNRLLLCLCVREDRKERGGDGDGESKD